MSEEQRKVYKGQKLVAVIEDVSTNQVLMSREYEVLEAPEDGDFEKGLKTQMVNEQWASPEAQNLHSVMADKPDPAKTALEVTKFAWEFIKDNKAISNAKDTTTSIIIKDTDPLDYEKAKEGKSTDVRFYVHDSIIKDWILVDTTSRLEGTFYATPSKPDIAHGHYMPAVHFSVVKIFVGFSFRLDAHAEVTAPSNLGTKDNVEPQVKIYAKFKVSWLDSNTHTAAFTANGVTGFRFAGWN